MLDKKNLKIIKVLKENSRLPIRKIAKRTGLRPSTVHNRIKRLVANNVIEKFTVKLNNKKVGESFIAFMLMSTKEDLPKTFFKNPHIKEVFGITGEHDLILKLKFRDIDDFNNFIINTRKNKNIIKTLTVVSTITLKEEI